MTGGGGSRKSNLIKTIYHTVAKTYRHALMNPEKPTALLAISISSFNPLLPKSDLKILLCLMPDDFTRQTETSWALTG